MRIPDKLVKKILTVSRIIKANFKNLNPYGTTYSVLRICSVCL